MEPVERIQRVRPGADHDEAEASLEGAERRRIMQLTMRAPMHPLHGALRKGLTRGMLTAQAEEQLALEVLANRLWRPGGGRPNAVRALVAFMGDGSIGAAAVLAALGDADGLRRMTAVAMDSGESPPRRLAAVRSALVVWQVAREQSDFAPAPLMAMLRRVSREGDEQLRYTATFVLAMMGRREVRPVLERGVLQLRSAALLSYCVLGLREVGNAESAQLLRRILPRTAGSLAELARDAIQAIELRVSPPRARPTFDLPADKVDFHARETVRLDLDSLR